MIYILWVAAKPQKYTLRAIVDACYQTDFIEVFIW